MAKKKAPETIAPKQFKAVNSVPGSDAPTYYANNANIDLSTFDVRLRFGQIQGAEGDILNVKEVAYVFMSHAHFRALLEAFKTSARKLDSFPPMERIGEIEKAP